VRNKYKGDDIQGRLGNTVIRYKDHPYFCVVEHTTLCLYDMHSGSLSVRVEPDDPFIDISSVPLGYVNIDQSDYKLAVYLKREGRRQFKQGVELGHLTQTPLRNGMGQLHWQHLKCKGLVDCILGKYPSFEQAVNNISKRGYHSVALSNNVAIKRENDTLKVFVKTDEVGFIKLGTNRLVMPKIDNSYVNICYLNEIKGWEITEGVK